MNEFQRRYIVHEKEGKKDKELNKIIEKYSKLIKEISENKNLSKEQINEEVRICRDKMQREIKKLDKDKLSNENII